MKPFSSLIVLEFRRRFPRWWPAVTKCLRVGVLVFDIGFLKTVLLE